MNVGIVGIGFMGKFHFNTWKTIKGVKVKAICDVDPKKRAGDWGGIGGNIAGGKKICEDLTGITAYADYRKMLKDPDIDIVDVTLPTYLHAQATIAAFKAGKHVICEKPMALTGADADRMIAAAKKAKRSLFVGHCLRFWPAYVNAREIVLSGKYGKVMSATFYRLAATPIWSWDNWLPDPKRSGNCILDLHIHDVDYVLHLFGRPKAVTTSAGGFAKGRLDHVVTTYQYNDTKLVVAEGAWEYAEGYPFTMIFTIAMEKATLRLTHDGKLVLAPRRGKPKELPLSPAMGYEGELRHFAECIRTGRKSKIAPPESAAESVRLVEAEAKSARTKRTVRF